MTGKWQVYRKVKGQWWPIGEPTSRVIAESSVARMRDGLSPEQFQVIQPHCVPV